MGNPPPRCPGHRSARGECSRSHRRRDGKTGHKKDISPRRTRSTRRMRRWRSEPRARWEDGEDGAPRRTRRARRKGNERAERRKGQMGRNEVEQWGRGAVEQGKALRVRPECPMPDARCLPPDASNHSPRRPRSTRREMHGSDAPRDRAAIFSVCVAPTGRRPVATGEARTGPGPSERNPWTASLQRSRPARGGGGGAKR